VVSGLRAVESDGLTHQPDGLPGLAGLVSGQPQKVIGLMAVRHGLQNTLAERRGFLQTPGGQRRLGFEQCLARRQRAGW
jgi:hypothetical protein